MARRTRKNRIGLYKGVREELFVMGGANRSAQFERKVKMTQAERNELFKAKQAKFDESVLRLIATLPTCNDSDIALRTGCTTRTARESIKRLRNNHIIWNFQDGLGYFIGETDTEDGNRLNDRWLSQEDSRAIQNFFHSTFARSQRKNPNQLTIQNDEHITAILNSDVVTVQSVAERYFEVMKKQCDGETISSCMEHSCKMYDSCLVIGNICPKMHDFSELTADQLTALEPYAVKWAAEMGEQT